MKKIILFSYLFLFALFSSVFSQCPQAQIDCLTFTDCDTVCAYSQITYGADTSISGQYYWQVSGNTSSTDPQQSAFNIEWGSGPFGTVILAVQNISQGCPLDYDTINVYIKPAPNPSVTGPMFVCKGDVFFYNTAPTPNVFNWNVTGGSLLGSSSNYNVAIQWDVPGLQSVCIDEIHSQSGCEDSQCQDIMVDIRPQASISGPVNVCLPDTVMYYGQGDQGLGYAWSVNNGTILGAPDQDSVTIVWGGGSGSSWLQLMVTNSSGCDTTMFFTAYPVDLPAPVVTGLDAVMGEDCEWYSTPNVSSNTYSWTVSNGQIQGASDSSAIEVCWGTSGQGFVSVIENNGPGNCDYWADLPGGIFITPRPECPVPELICLEDSSIMDCELSCIGEIRTYYTPHDEVAVYTWYSQGEDSISFLGSDSVEIEWGSGSMGMLIISATDSFGFCAPILDTFEIVLQTPVEIEVSGLEAVCGNGDPEWYSVQNDSTIVLNWTTTAGELIGVSDSSDIYFDLPVSGVAELCVVSTTTAGCEFSDCHSISVIDTVIPNPSGPDSLCLGETGSYCSSLTAGNQNVWTTGSATIVDVPNGNCIDLLWDSPGEYELELTQVDTLYGCESSVSELVTVIERPVSAFSGSDSVIENDTSIAYSATFISGVSYIWEVSGGSISGDVTDHNILINWDVPGLGSVCLTTLSGLSDCDSTICLEVRIDSLEDTLIGIPSEFAFGYSVFPNPFDNQIVVSFDRSVTGPTELVLTDITGRVLRKVEYSRLESVGTNLVLDSIENLESGIYLLTITVNGQRVVTKLKK